MNTGNKAQYLSERTPQQKCQSHLSLVKEEDFNNTSKEIQLTGKMSYTKHPLKEKSTELVCDPLIKKTNLTSNEFIIYRGY
jgi:hypothetical protein